MKSNLRIVVAGGGTGGHLFPGLAIADALRMIRPDVQITFIGSKGKIEERVVPARGYQLRTIWISGFSRQLSAANALFPLKVAVSVWQSLLLLRGIQPAAVVGTGGYVCGPPLFAAKVLGIPTLIQEQNSYPGVTTRLLAGWATEVHLTFERSKRFLRRTHTVHLTGNPTRAAIGTVSRVEAAAALGLDPSRMTLLVIGGSQGAVSINSAMLPAVPRILERGMQILWGTGERDFERVNAAVQAYGVPGVHVHRFFEHMEFAYAASDLAVARAGATTLAELMRCGLPAVLVPYPFAAGDHQTENARAMVEAGGAIMCRDSELSARLMPMLEELCDDAGRRAEMGRRARQLGNPKAAEELAGAVLRLAGA